MNNENKAPAVALLKSYLDSGVIRAAELARAIGVQRTNVSHWLSGKSRPSRAVALRVEAATGGAVRASDWYLAAEHRAAAAVRGRR